MFDDFSFRDAMLFCDVRDHRYAGLSLDDLIDNIDGNAGDDEEEEDDLDDDNYADIQENDSDEPHTLQVRVLFSCLEKKQYLFI